MFNNEAYEALLKITSEVYKIYIELYNLEVNNKYGTQEYLSCYERLKTTLALEDNIFKRLFCNLDTILVGYNKIRNLKNHTNNSNNDIQIEGLIINFKFNDLVLIRLLNKLLLHLFILKDEIKERKSYLLPSMIILGKDYNLKKKIIPLYLAIIERNEKLDRTQVIFEKYKSAMIYPETEQDLLSSRFITDLNPYILNDNHNEDSTNQFLINILYCGIINSLFKNSNSDYLSKIVLTDALKRQSFFKALLLLLDEKDIKEIKQSCEGLSEDTYKGMELSYKILIDAFDLEKEREIPRYIHFIRS